jgi:hypothetical protein
MQSRFGGVLDGVSLDRYYIRDMGIFNKMILLPYQNGSPIVCILIETSLSTPECGKSFTGGITLKNVRSGNGFLQWIIAVTFGFLTGHE